MVGIRMFFRTTLLAFFVLALVFALKSHCKSRILFLCGQPSSGCISQARVLLKSVRCSSLAFGKTVSTVAKQSLK